MPVVAAPLFWAAIAGAGATVAGGAIAAHAAGEAANTQANAANHAADVQGQTNAQALAFQRQQAENDYRNQEAARQANYQQYLGHYNAAQALGQRYGFNVP